MREGRDDHEDIFLHENKGARKRLNFGYVIEEAKLHGQLAVEVWGKLPSWRKRCPKLRPEEHRPGWPEGKTENERSF